MLTSFRSNTSLQAQRARRPLSNDDLRRLAPSIFADRPWHAMSDRYAFIPTIDVIDKMRSEGFTPFDAEQARTRIPGKGEFTKHVVRFRREDSTALLPQLGNLYPELVLMNSHDGASAYALSAGMYRLVCMNGLMVADSTVQEIKTRHTGDAGLVIDASFEVIDQMPKALEQVQRFGEIRLLPEARQHFAEAAMSLRYDEDKAPVPAAAILRPRRTADQEPTLWNTFNTIQEHLTQGGARGFNNAQRRRTSVRAVNGITENARLNRALWQLTEHMAKLVS